MFMDRDEVDKHAKKNEANIIKYIIKDVLYDLKHQKKICDLAGPSEKSRAGKIDPSCPLG